MPEKISILLSADDRYARYCAVTMLSILENTSTPEKVFFYILSPDISTNNIEKIKEVCFQFGALVSVIPINLGLFKELPVCQVHFNLNVYSRFYGPELCQNCKRMIYLDCDLVVLADIAELFNYDLEGKTLGAVPHVQFPYQDLFKKQFDIDGEDVYFNSGALLIDTIYWVQKKCSAGILQYATENASKLHFADQDALNAIFWKNYCHLPGIWNVEARLYKEKWLGLPQNEELSKRMRNPKIIHYTGSDKPWLSRKYLPMRQFYTYYSDRLAERISWFPSQPEARRCNVWSFLNFVGACLRFRFSYNLKKILKNRT